MKFMLPVVYFNNTKSEVKITLKKSGLVVTVSPIVQKRRNQVCEILLICSSLNQVLSKK